MKVHKAVLKVGLHPQRYLLSGPVVHMECRNDADIVEFWFLADSEEERERWFDVFGTGQFFDPESWDYVATAAHASGLVWHLLERKQ